MASQLNLDTIMVPFDFFIKYEFLNFSDIYWGYINKLVGWHDVVLYASSKIETSGFDENVIKLSLIDKEYVHNIDCILSAIINKSKCLSCSSKKKWLYIILAWIYENNDKLNDPLGLVERIYADFDYPAEMESFVRFMPCTDGYDPSANSLDANTSRLMRKWLDYINNIDISVN